MALKQYGVHFVLFTNKGNKIGGVVLNRVLKLRGMYKVCILGIFVLNRVRVSNPLRLTYTQILVEYPPPRVKYKRSQRGGSFDG